MLLRSPRLLASLGLTSFLAVSVFGQDIGPVAQQQIAAILAAKASFNAAENKMSSNLAFSARMANNQSLGSIAGLINTIGIDPSGLIEVDIAGQVSDALLAQIASIGGTVMNSAPQYGVVRALVPVTAAGLLAGRTDVSSVREADRFVVNSHVAPRAASRPKGYQPFIGALTSQGYVTHQANLVNALNINGSGVRVGVLSDSATAARVSALIASGDLAPGTTVLPGLASTGTDEGAAIMEIIQDMAPGAQIFFATGNGGQSAMASNIVALRTAGCDIIVDDLTYFAEAAFQDGPIAQAVSQVKASGALYFSSAANSGNLTQGTSGTWEGDYLAGTAVGAPVSATDAMGTYHNFATAGAPQYYDSLTATSTYISLKWSDPQGASTNDYDLFILDSTGTTVKGFSATRQTGTQNPFEAIQQGTNCGTATAAGYCPVVGDRIVVVLYSGSPRALRVDTNRGRLSIATAGSTFGHNGGVDTVTVAATYWNSARAGTKAFTGFANAVETFSSDGPRKIFYNPNGTAITPGNVLFATNGGTTLAKPDITAADGVSAKTPGFLPFFGTSAAAPHAAAIAALVKSAKPSLTNTQVLQIMYNTALDNMAVGPDRDGGRGIVMALPAVQQALQ